MRILSVSVRQDDNAEWSIGKDGWLHGIFDQGLRQTKRFGKIKTYANMKNLVHTFHWNMHVT